MITGKQFARDEKGGRIKPNQRRNYAMGEA
jgi:hypothetical protein